ncbi:MAG TPA: LysR family transcriptional regulator [Polyangia bacterium]|nr:LysR family transcriptional regulator [Polyangia bacterium]
MDILWDDLRVFLAIASERTLSAAARRLKVDQSTVGRRLAALEAATSARLFDRTPDGYVLTAAGAAVLPNIQDIETAAITVARKLVGGDARLEGRVLLATSDSFATWFLLPRLQALREQHAGISVDLVTGNRPANLARREADVSVRFSRPEQPHVVARRLGQAAWALYGSEPYVGRFGLPGPRTQLEGHAVIGFGDELRGTAGARWLAENGARGRVVLRSDSLLSQAAAVAAGLGICPLPCLFGDPHPHLRRLLPGIVGHHDIWLVVHPDVRTSARVRVVMDYLAALIKKETPLLSGRLSRPKRRR